MKTNHFINIENTFLENIRSCLLSGTLILFAFTNLQAQEPGFEVSSDHIVLFGNNLDGAGVKAFWWPEKAAFRAGQVFPGSNAWDADSLGTVSTAFGVNNKAEANLSMSWGQGNSIESTAGTAWGSFNRIRPIYLNHVSTVWGNRNEIFGGFSTMWGNENRSLGFLSTVWGDGNKVDSANAKLMTVWGSQNSGNASLATVWGELNVVTGEQATSWGNDNEVTSMNGTVWGAKNEVKGSNGTSWGTFNEASGAESTAFGGSNIASGSRSVAMGLGNESRGYASTTIGLYATPLIDAPMTVPPLLSVDDFPLLTVGNGKPVLFGEPEKSNAFTVSYNGYVGINKQTMPQSDLHIKQSKQYSDLDNTGGIRLEETNEADGFWQVNIGRGDLHFSRNNELVAVLNDDGTWRAKAFNDVIFLSRANKSKITEGLLQDVIFGTSKDGAIVLDAKNLLKSHPQLVGIDENGKIQSVDYQQLYLLSIMVLQEQQELISSQEAMIKENRQRLKKIEASISAN